MELNNINQLFEQIQQIDNKQGISNFTQTNANYPNEVRLYEKSFNLLSRYCSADFKQLLLQYGLRQSMSRRGNCFDNVVVESFFIHSKHTLFVTVTTKRGNWLIKHYLNILKSIIIGYAVIQLMAGYHLNNMNNNITKTKK